MTRSVPDVAALPADLRQGLDRLAADAVGAFGPPPLAELVETHFAIFADLRQRGASWAQIAALLAACGIVGDAGVFSEAVVRATHGRIARARRTAISGHGRRDAAKYSATERNTAERSATKRTAVKRDGANRVAAQCNDVPQDATGEALAQRFSLIDKPWHMR